MALTNVFTGSDATLTLASESTPEGADAKAIQDTYEIQAVGRLTNVEVHVQTDVFAYHEIGRRLPTSLHPGDVTISGTADRAHVNGALLFLLLGRGASATNVPEPYVQPVFNISLQLNDRATPGNTLGLELKGVRFDNWSLALPEEDFVMERVSFKALMVSVVDKEAATGGGEATARAPGFPDATTATA